MRIESAKKGTGYATVPAGATQTLALAEPGAPFCVSDTVPGWLMCKLQHMSFGAEGAVVTAFRH